MTARCHNDSCSIEWSEVSTLDGLKYQADVVLDPARSLSCIEDAGVGVVISPNAGNIVSNAGNGLYAGIPDHVIEAFGDSSYASMGQGVEGGAPTYGSVYSYLNATGKDATVIVAAELSVRYGILGTGHSYDYASGNGKRSGALTAGAIAGAVSVDVVGFNAMFGARLLSDVDGAGDPTSIRASARMPVGGATNLFDANGIQYQSVRSTVTWATDVPSGSTIEVRGGAFYEGSSQTVNVVTAQSIPNLGTDVGFQIARGQFIVIPHG